MKTNFIIHQQAKQYDWSGDCFLSVKSFYNGSANYQIKQRSYQVNQSNFLLLNECTNYRLVIDHIEPIESFCVFFAPEFVAEVVTEYYSSTEQILDFNTNTKGSIQLFERNYPHQGLISKLLIYGRIKSQRGMSEMEQDEFYYALLNAMLQQDELAVKESQRLQSKKASTQKEVYQRIYFVKDFIDGNYHKALSLEELAKVGCLSKNHLLLNFKQIFGCTPFQYLSNRRIQEAQRQIITTDKAIKDIAIDVGYSSFNNFSSYFKSIVGKSPSTLRKK